LAGCGSRVVTILPQELGHREYHTLLAYQQSERFVGRARPIIGNQVTRAQSADPGGREDNVHGSTDHSDTRP
jgi:uncharacterized protein with FMN-binding domain